MNTIKQKLIELLTENTGKALCDSGDAYGRNYERNQNIDFDKTDRVSFDLYTDSDGNTSIDFSVSLYHFFSEILEINDVTDFLNSQYSKWYDSLNDDDVCGVDLFVKFINGTTKQECMYNTYNYENNLSQVFQFYVFQYNNEFYAIIEIHGGCDVRGGYTDSCIFKLNGYLTGNVDVYGSIDGIDVSNTYNGYSLTDDDGNEININENSNINLDFHIMDDVYMYE
jgi:hypothetical protein